MRFFARRPGWCLGISLLCLTLAPNRWGTLFAQTLPEAAGPTQLSGKVTDENGVVVAGARLTFRSASASAALTASPDRIGANPEKMGASTDSIGASTDQAGQFVVSSIAPGAYELTVEKEGFYALLEKNLLVKEGPNTLDITLHHQREFEERVNVIYSPPTIDPQQTQVEKKLTSAEIVALPYPGTHDFRNALPLIPGVILDSSGQIHLNGGSAAQAFYTLDGFNAGHPVTGTLESRLSVDALRSVEVQTSRYSAEYGKGSAGVLALKTGMGDDRLRFSATNFLPGVKNHDGLVLDEWTPRATLSGPLKKGKAWLFEALDAFYNLTVIDELPKDANRSHYWDVHNLLRSQVNLTPANRLTGGLLVSYFSGRYLGLNVFDPRETTFNEVARDYFFSVKDQATLRSGAVLEVGFALTRVNASANPLGNETYRISTEGRSGNYFLTARLESQRLEWLANLLLPAFRWHGTHYVRGGLDVERVSYRQFAERHPLEILRADGTRSRLATFAGGPTFRRNNSAWGGYIQDRWSPTERVLVEVGLRADWDQIVRDPVLSPRLALTFSPQKGNETKFSAGVGLFYDAINLGLLTRHLDQHRFDTFYAPDGITPARGPLETFFQVNEASLKVPYALNWSAGFEQKLPLAFYLRANFIQRRTYQGFVFENVVSPGQPRTNKLVRGQQNQFGGILELRNARKDRYDSFETTVRRTFRKTYYWMASYTRSSARTNRAVDFRLENLLVTGQGEGPLSWDTPNRLLSWVWLPLVRKFDLAAFFEWRDGFPFSVVDSKQELAELPNRRRFPSYFSLNLHLERRFSLLHYQWALRAGYNNITGHANPNVVDNNVDSPRFLLFAGGQHRALTARIRFLGRK